MKRLIVMNAVIGIAACSTSGEAPILVETPGHAGVVEPVTTTSIQQSSGRAVGDLARRLSISTTEIRVVSAAEVDWRSSAIGCPESDRLYMTVLTPGYHIVVEARGVQYHYHGSTQGAPFLCPEERREPPAGSRA